MIGPSEQPTEHNYTSHRRRQRSLELASFRSSGVDRGWPDSFGVPAFTDTVRDLRGGLCGLPEPWTLTSSAGFADNRRSLCFGEAFPNLGP